jgi:hypothetical protein
MRNSLLIISTLIFFSCGNSQIIEKAFLEKNLPQNVNMNPDFGFKKK